MSISYEGIGEWCATFVCGAVSEGDIVKVSANGTVGKCTAGDGFCGVVPPSHMTARPARCSSAALRA